MSNFNPPKPLRRQNTPEPRSRAHSTFKSRLAPILGLGAPELGSLVAFHDAFPSPPEGPSPSPSPQGFSKRELIPTEVTKKILPFLRQRSTRGLAVGDPVRPRTVAWEQEGGGGRRLGGGLKKKHAGLLQGVGRSQEGKDEPSFLAVVGSKQGQADVHSEKRPHTTAGWPVREKSTPQKAKEKLSSTYLIRKMQTLQEHNEASGLGCPLPLQQEDEKAEIRKSPKKAEDLKDLNQEIFLDSRPGTSTGPRKSRLATSDSQKVVKYEILKYFQPRRGLPSVQPSPRGAEGRPRSFPSPHRGYTPLSSLRHKKGRLQGKRGASRPHSSQSSLRGGGGGKKGLCPAPPKAHSSSESEPLSPSSLAGEFEQASSGGWGGRLRFGRLRDPWSTPEEVVQWRDREDERIEKEWEEQKKRRQEKRLAKFREKEEKKAKKRAEQALLNPSSPEEEEEEEEEPSFLDSIRRSRKSEETVKKEEDFFYESEVESSKKLPKQLRFEAPSDSPRRRWAEAEASLISDNFFKKAKKISIFQVPAKGSPVPPKPPISLQEIETQKNKNQVFWGTKRLKDRRGYPRVGNLYGKNNVRTEKVNVEKVLLNRLFHEKVGREAEAQRDWVGVQKIKKKDKNGNKIEDKKFWRRANNQDLLHKCKALLETVNLA